MGEELIMYFGRKNLVRKNVVRKNVGILIVLLCTLFLSTAVCFAKDITKGSSYSENKQQISDSIEKFFKSYEKALDNEDANFSDIENLYSSDGNIKNKALAKAILYRGIILSQEYPGGKLKELNKQLYFEYESYNIDKINATVTVYVTKTFNYNITLDTQSGERNKYVITLKKGKEWKIINIDGFIDEIISEDFDGKGINTEDIASLNKYRKNLKQDVKDFYKEFSKELSNATVAKSNSTVDNQIMALTESNSTLGNQIMEVASTATTYNRSGATKYAMDHAYNYNPDYHNYDGNNGDGRGDCTNFISQCLHDGGGLKEHTGTVYSDTCWFYTTSGNRSSSWTGAEQFNSYIKSSVSKINASVSSFNSVGFGDIIQLINTSTGDASHSLIVTGIVYNGSGRCDLLFCCHSTDKLNFSLANTYGSRKKEFFHIIGNK